MSKIAKIFGLDAPSIPAPAPAPPPPQRSDPQTSAQINEARDRVTSSELAKKGRRRAQLTSGSGLDDELGAGTSLSRPQARAAQLGG